jgi:transposase InsO family protein
VLLFTLLLGYLLGRLQNHHWRRDRRAALGRKFQLIAERNENAGFRRKGKRPSLGPWQKWLLGLLHWISPTLTRYTLFRPATLVGWHQRYVKRYWWLISGKPQPNRVGRPRIAPSVEQIILDIKASNPSYGAERIAALVTEQLGMPVSESTVRNVLKRHRCPTTPPRQSWKTFLKNHRHLLASMDFKVTFDWRARPLYILSVIDHQRRRLVHCRSTYHPTSDWVAQQMREAFPFDEAPAMMLMDHDSIFLPIIKNTLPAMGVRVIRTAVGCPRQNGTIERFNRTLNEELLDHVIPLNSKHLNGLLAEYQRFYNTARPHQANKGQASEHQVAANDTAFAPGMLRAEAIPWLGGLHHSYRRAA